jgi:NAD(P)-dependent dehydrogenase (short-subunit alcohol dehydrogenase family)
MLAQGSGHIITVASVAGGMVVFPNRCAYVASKAAALMLAKAIAIDYAKQGIRSNAVCPALVYTPMTAWRLDNPQWGVSFPPDTGLYQKNCSSDIERSFVWASTRNTHPSIGLRPFV